MNSLYLTRSDRSREYGVGQRSMLLLWDHIHIASGQTDRESMGNGESQTIVLLRIGHIGLVRAALVHGGVPEEKHESVLNAIAMSEFLFN